ncbi:MAG: cache domain-containing protein [Xanthobacteraceae bacterium]|nr:cache domain-containing protein [Xanthobacteraceae bacterium]
MHKLTAASAIAALALLWSALSAGAQQLGTAHEAKAMLERAVVALKADQANALSEFNDKSNKQFHENDLYVFCFNATTGNTLAHPNPALMGTDVRAFRFKDDPIGQRLFDAAKGAGIATVDYVFPKPGTIEPVPKESFVTRIGDLGCGVGYYK